MSPASTRVQHRARDRRSMLVSLLEAGGAQCVKDLQPQYRAHGYTDTYGMTVDNDLRALEHAGCVVPLDPPGVRYRRWIAAPTSTTDNDQEN